MQQIQCRYSYLRANTFSNQHINSIIDSLQNFLNVAQQRHYTRYAILGKYTWPNDWIPPTYNQEVDTLRNWAIARLNWMDGSLLVDTCLYNDGVTELIARDNKTGYAQVFPNPSTALQTISMRIYLTENKLLQLQLFDVTGRKVWSNEMKLTSGTHIIPVKNQFTPGIYFLKLNDELHISAMKIVIAE